MDGGGADDAETELVVNVLHVDADGAGPGFDDRLSTARRAGRTRPG